MAGCLLASCCHSAPACQLCAEDTVWSLPEPSRCLQPTRETAGSQPGGQRQGKAEGGDGGVHWASAVHTSSAAPRGGQEAAPWRGCRPSPACGGAPMERDKPSTGAFCDFLPPA